MATINSVSVVPCIRVWYSKFVTAYEKAAPITEKPLEVRQGKGKGNVEYWVAQIQPGKVMYEVDGVPEELAREAFRLAARKLPFKTTFVTKQVM